MKKLALILCLCCMLSGCTGGMGNTTLPSQETTHSSSAQPSSSGDGAADTTNDAEEAVGTADTEAAGLLAAIWEACGENERFSAYGGTIEHAVENAPGDLDMENTEELATKYLIPEDQLASVEAGASLVHLMNSNIFTGSAFRLAQGVQANVVAKAIRDNIQRTEWICGQPDRMLIAQYQGHLLIAFGEQELMQGIQAKLTQVFPEAQMLYNEAVTE